MIIKETYLEDEHYERSGYSIEVSTGTDGRTLRFLDGEPEDATINRDFSDVHKIYALVKMAYDAGCSGEDFESSSNETDDVEDFF